MADLLDAKLQKGLDKQFSDLENRNEVQSTRLCEQLESQVRLRARFALSVRAHLHVAPPLLSACLQAQDPGTNHLQSCVPCYAIRLSVRVPALRLRVCSRTLDVQICRRPQCEAHVEKLASMTLPSLGRFDAKSNGCVTTFNARCVGPAQPVQYQRLRHALEREKARFQREYNDRLYNGLVVSALVLAVVSRFVLKRLVLEVIGWCSFIFLEVRLPHSRIYTLLPIQCAIYGAFQRISARSCQEHVDLLVR